jgi:hypothetical protein
MSEVDRQTYLRTGYRIRIMKYAKSQPPVTDLSLTVQHLANFERRSGRPTISLVRLEDYRHQRSHASR